MDGKGKIKQPQTAMTHATYSSETTRDKLYLKKISKSWDSSKSTKIFKYWDGAKSKKRYKFWNSSKSKKSPQSWENVKSKKISKFRKRSKF